MSLSDCQTDSGSRLVIACWGLVYFPSKDVEFLRSSSLRSWSLVLR